MNVEEEPESTALVPDAFIDSLLLCFRCFEGGFLALDESHCEEGVEDCVSDPVVVLVDLFLFFFTYWAVVDVHDALGALLEDGYLLYEWVDGACDLRPW